MHRSDCFSLGKYFLYSAYILWCRTALRKPQWPDVVVCLGQNPSPHTNSAFFLYLYSGGHSATWSVPSIACHHDYNG